MARCVSLIWNKQSRIYSVDTALLETPTGIVLFWIYVTAFGEYEQI